MNITLRKLSFCFVALAAWLVLASGCAHFRKESDKPWNEPLRRDAPWNGDGSAAQDFHSPARVYK